MAKVTLHNEAGPNGTLRRGAVDVSPSNSSETAKVQLSSHRDGEFVLLVSDHEVAAVTLTRSQLKEIIALAVDFL